MGQQNLSYHGFIGKPIISKLNISIYQLSSYSFQVTNILTKKEERDEIFPNYFNPDSSLNITIFVASAGLSQPRNMARSHPSPAKAGAICLKLKAQPSLQFSIFNYNFL